MDDATYQITALRYASMLSRYRRDNFLIDDDHAAPMPIDYYVWLVQGAGRTILVDTGMDHEEGTKRGRQLSRLPREALAAVGVEAEQIDTVVITHLHYDHAGTLDHYPSARFHIQEAEMAYATGRCMCDMALQKPFTADHVCQMVRNVYSGRVQFHDGDGTVAPEITVHHVGGHSKGLQFVRVKTGRGYVVLASDAAHFYETIEARKPFPIVHSVEEMLRGWDRINALATSPGHVIPGHDPLVVRRYPALNAATNDFAVRVDAVPLL